MLKIIYYYLSNIKYYIIFCFLILTYICMPAEAVKYSGLKEYSIKKSLWVHKLLIKTGLIYKLNTAPGYVSVITLPVIPLDVALGNTEAFSEQIVGRQIFIKPVTYDMAETSNLEIYTKYGLINILLRIKTAKLVTYNLDISNSIKDVFVKNYINNKIKALKAKFMKKYFIRQSILDKKTEDLKAEKKEIMSLILLINRIKINKSVTKEGITLTVISISRIKNFYYLRYQLTNNSGSGFFVRNAYLYGEYGGNFFDGFVPDKITEIPIINDAPHNVSYMPYKIARNVLIFKKSKTVHIDGAANTAKYGDGGNLEISFHILKGKKLIKLKICGI